jgi:hypothetical protein
MSILVLTSDTLIGTPATGNLEYNGQFYGTDSNASRAQLQRITQGTSVASTSGTSIDFTGLPAWVKRITVMLKGVSTNGTSLVVVRAGTSGGFVASGYVGANWMSNANNTAYSTGLLVGALGAANYVFSGFVTLALQDSSTNTWTSSTIVGDSGGVNVSQGGGYISLSGTLTQIRITTVNGTDTFDAGSINILYEG